MWCAAAHIALHGGAWWAALGTPQSSGTKLHSVSGDCERPGIYEYPFGVTIEQILEVRQGAVCTSGDARRFLLKDGIRYGHILDPRTGWPVVAAPRLVTVAAGNCTEAGLLSTLAMLSGAGAEEFLAAQQVPHWIVRD